MSLYEIAVADGRQGERAAVLLPLLDSAVFPRLRDVWVEKHPDGPLIAVYTRQGGGNRECHCEGGPGSARFAERHVPASCYAAANEALAKHPLYVRDADDSFDATYATFWFRLSDQWPDDILEALAEIAQDPVDMSARWQQAIDRIGSGQLRPAETALADQLGAFLSDPAPGSPKIMEV
jgi:hypothetical protein